MEVREYSMDDFEHVVMTAEDRLAERLERILIGVAAALTFAGAAIILVAAARVVAGG